MLMLRTGELDNGLFRRCKNPVSEALRKFAHWLAAYPPLVVPAMTEKGNFTPGRSIART